MPEVSALDAKKIIDSGGQLIDIRTEVEYEAGHIPGARHVALADVQREAGGPAKDKPVIIYCRSGNRSRPAAEPFDGSADRSEAVLSGGESEAQLIGFRLKQGVAGQREPAGQMMRIKLPLGGVTPDQMDACADIAEQSTPLAKGHITTRQNFQFHPI